MTETLRWILIALAVIVLLGIWLQGRRASAATSPSRARRVEPRTVEDGELEAASPEADAFEHPAPRENAPRAAPWRAPADEAPPARRGGRRGERIEPTLTPDEPSDGPEASAKAERPDGPARAAPTLSLSDTPAPRRIERRKIIALRLAATSERFGGEALRVALESEALVHGKYQVFHRLDADGSSIFSVASMVEPGTFELDEMARTDYAGITLFAQLPGPVEGAEAVDLLVSCARNLQESLGGSLQDERGIELTDRRVERLRAEVVEFEQALARNPQER